MLLNDCRSEDAIIISGLVSLEAQDMQHLRELRRQFQSFLAAVSSGFRPEALKASSKRKACAGTYITLILPVCRLLTKVTTKPVKS